MTAKERIRRRVAIGAGATCIAALAGGLLLWAPGGGDDESGGDAKGAELSSAQRSRADQMVSVFENGTTKVQYGYAENLHDGRGITAGRIGFTTSDGDALTVIQAYTEKVPDNPLASFVPELKRLKEDNSGDTEGLPEGKYIAAWKKASEDADFREIQDQQVDKRYYGPAMREADLARAELYDTAVQHGTGSDADSLHALVTRTTEKVGTVGEAGEKEWLGAFLTTRAKDLTSPANTATADEWKRSVDRVEAVRRLARSGDYDLDGSHQLVAFGETYTLS
jgi:chitosanase